MKKDKLIKDDLIHRIEDWKKRIGELYAAIGEWLKDDKQYLLKTTDTIELYEEPMQKHRITPQHIPIADILKNGKLILTIKPFGLWVVGANGRIDIISDKGSQILADTSDDSQSPRWKILSPKSRKKEVPFTKEYLMEIIR